MSLCPCSCKLLCFTSSKPLSKFQPNSSVERYSIISFKQKNIFSTSSINCIMSLSELCLYIHTCTCTSMGAVKYQFWISIFIVSEFMVYVFSLNRCWTETLCVPIAKKETGTFRRLSSSVYNRRGVWEDSVPGIGLLVCGWGWSGTAGDQSIQTRGSGLSRWVFVVKLDKLKKESTLLCDY